MIELTVSKRESGLRIDKYISMKADVNQAFLFMMERKKQVRINGIHMKSLKDTLKEGDVVKLYIDEKLIKKKRAPRLPFDIIYEDENILVVDKPKKISIHSIEKTDHNNLVDICVKYLINKEEYIPSTMKDFRPSVSIRLDTNTSGLVIMSKNKETLQELNSLIEKRKIKKEYLALVAGTPKKKKYIMSDFLSGPNEKYVVRVTRENIPGSKPIKTGYEVIEERDGMSTLLIDLLTGRTHQIRAHMAFISNPVIGDDKYGDRQLNDRLNIHTQQLIAYKLTFGGIESERLSYLNGMVLESKMKFDI